MQTEVPLLLLNLLETARRKNRWNWIGPRLRHNETRSLKHDFYNHIKRFGFEYARASLRIVCSFLGSSVAYPGCLSRIPDPDFYPSRIPDPRSKNSNKREGWKKFVVITLYVATNFTKLHIILVLMSWRKKFGQIFKEL